MFQLVSVAAGSFAMRLPCFLSSYQSWTSTKESDSWRVQRKKARPGSTTAVLQIRRPFSEKQRVIWILAPLTRRNCSIGNWRKRQPKKCFLFHKALNEPQKDSIEEQTARRPSCLMIRQRHHIEWDCGPKRTFQLRLSSLHTKPTLGNALLVRFSQLQLQLRCSTSNSSPQASSPRSELSAKWAANVIDFGRADQNLSSKTLASYFQSKKRTCKVVRRRRKTKKKKTGLT